MSTMKAVVLEAPGPPDALQIRDLPIPTPGPEQVLIKVAAFGLNRSELHTRLGLAQGVTFPRVLGIEAAGTVAACPNGMLSNQWTVRDFYPIDYIPRGVRLTAYTGGATDLPANVLQDFLDAVAAREAVVPIPQVYPLDEIQQAHAEMEAGSATGKIVVLTRHGPRQ